MKVIGSKIYGQVVVLNDILMEIHTMANFKMEKPTEKVYINGQMEKYMMESGTLA